MTLKGNEPKEYGDFWKVFFLKNYGEKKTIYMCPLGAEGQK